jgi:galactokinase/mevalonate kinase-like predicted kinase
MLEQFGGGIELTTLAAIPKGSGLGTSSIMGAVILAVIHRVMGRTLTQKELFHAVLRLEQSLTTGGGWQDQIGGAIGGTKIISTEPGLIPDAKIHYLPADVLDPKVNNGQTLLYYTGITRLAKGILGQVVGRYLDRNRRTLSTLRQIHELAPQVGEALSRKDIQAFGQLVDVAWQLNKQLDPNSTNDQVETLLSRIQPHIFGAKLLGAGGGGFLLMVCKSPQDARNIKMMLDAEPPNKCARFFDYDVNPDGLVVTVC